MEPRSQISSRRWYAAIVLIVLGAGAPLACTGIQRAGSAVIDCVEADRAKINALIVDFATKTEPDGSRDWSAIEADAIDAGISIGGCALAEFVNSGTAARTQSAVPDPALATLERVRARFGGATWRTSSGLR